ncbi:unnamed protein product [Cuscuta europaea]|uniref:Nuclear pore complex protein NUP88 n=1 Tax=Cuscuta europaea TaxID=41803 RepID=A0A9P1EAI6_CUSEU|nr:unnamed protein product [Cuscuta europaea]
MRFTFDLGETDSDTENRQSITPPSNTTPKEESQWIPLQNHPVFTTADVAAQTFKSFKMPKNLLAWDGASRLYYWDPFKRCLHRISIRLGEPDSSVILASSLSKVLQADVQIHFEVDKISINRNGSAIFLVGIEGLCIMYLYGRTSTTKEHTITCRTVSAGSDIYFTGKKFIHTLQISWHPYSDTHLGILSSDSVFRIFDLSSALVQPEQEYYLQPIERGTSCDAAALCPVDFSFGGDHLWDRFSVFVLFSDGSIYVLCPVVPFGSVYKWESILELYNDVHAFGLKSTTSRANTNSNLAITWLEATFPELRHVDVKSGNLIALQAQPYALFDASVALQGPLCKFSNNTEDPQVQSAICEGRAVSFLYNVVSKDSILVTAWSGGQLQIDALADEIHPVWKVGSPARLCVDSNDCIVGLAMISELAHGDDHSILKSDLPPLLRLAIVDLCLPKKTGYTISMCVDPLRSERIYCAHTGGVDSVVLHFLPFTNQNIDKEEFMKSPSVHSVLITCQGESSLPSPLCAFLALSDPFGDSWIVGITCNFQCIVLEAETWNAMPHVVDEVWGPTGPGLSKDTNGQTILSRELFTGPKLVLLPPSPEDLHCVTSDSIEGRATLHQYFKRFHENYVEYAHKVHFELQHHAPHLKKIIDEQHSRYQKSQQKLVKVEKNQEILENRFEHAVQRHAAIVEKLQRLRSLPVAHKRSLSRAEQVFKSEIEKMQGIELDVLRSSIETLNARLIRYKHSIEQNQVNEKRETSSWMKSRHVLDNQMSQLKASLEKLSLANSENTKKVKLVESALRTLKV